VRHAALVTALAALAGNVSCSSSDARVRPVITSVSPDHGSSIGGATITVTGTALASGSGTSIAIVGEEQAVVETATDTMVTFVLPAGIEQSVVDITISDDSGFAIAPAAFTYNPLPLVLAISPAGGTAGGGTPVMLTGRGFSDLEAGAVSLVIGGGSATNVVVQSDTMLTAVTGATPPGTPAFTPLDVELADANGSASLANAYSTTKQGLLMLSRNDQSLSFFDPTTKDIKRIGTFPTRLHSCALGADGVLYGTGRDPTTGVHSLFTFDGLNASTTLVGPTNDGSNGAQYGISSLAFVGSTLFGFVDGPCCSSTIKRLVTIDPATGSATLVGPSPVTAARGQVIGTRDGATVFYAETSSGTLDTLSTTTSARVTGPTMSGSTSGTGIKVHGLITVGDTLFLLEEGNPSVLYSVNPVSGVLTEVSTVVSLGQAVCLTPPSF
jgi:hypothetical protein